MMTDPAFPIKNEVQQLVDVQIDTLRKQSSLTSFELNEYHSRPERITTLYEKLDLIAGNASTLDRKRPLEPRSFLRGTSRRSRQFFRSSGGLYLKP